MNSTNPSSQIPLVLADCGDSVAVERAIWELATRLPRDRFDARVWLSSDPAKEPFAAALESRGVAVDRMPAPGAGWAFKRAIDVWSRLRRARPQVLHLHYSWPSRDGVSTPLADMAGVPHRIVTAHGGRDPVTTRGATRAALERADVITTTCDGFADQLVRETGLARDCVRRIPSGVDPPEEAAEADAVRVVRERLGAGMLRPLWVFAGRFEPHRGAAVFVEALGIARERGLPFIAVLSGEGHERAVLQHRLDELGLEGSARILDAPEELGPLLGAADLVVVPSLWDGVSNVLLQALARSRPVIASAVGGAPDVIENGVTGRLVPPGDPRALADALESFHRRPEAAARLGREAARRIRDTHDWSAVVDAYEAVYDEVLGLASFVPDVAVARGRW